MIKGLPDGVDPAWAEAYLCQSFEEHSGMPHLFEMELKSLKWKLDRKDLVKRLGKSDIICK